jgi:hypothetical protein
MMDGQLNAPYGLRFGDDGGEVVVADWFNDRVMIFRTGNGAFVRHAATGVGAPFDVEECEGGWLVACTSSDTAEYVGGASEGAVGPPSACPGSLAAPRAWPWCLGWAWRCGRRATSGCRCFSEGQVRLDL